MLPAGIILLWFGAIDNIPAGYVLCNGNNGTPDLRNNFVVGAGLTYAVDATGGSTFHGHDFTANAHTHTIPAGSGIETGIGVRNVTDPTNATGSTDGALTLPPYHALAYIMKT